MEITELFTKKNIEILTLLEKERLHIRDIAHKLSISPAKVHASIKLFKEHNLVKEIKQKNKHIIHLNRESSLLKEIQSLLQGKKDDTMFSTKIDLFDTISPLDFRYYGRNEMVFSKLQPYLTENAMIKYMVKVEAALANNLAKQKICSKTIAEEIEHGCKKVVAEEVYQEEDRVKHNVRALVNNIRKHVSDEAKPYVHFTTTSHDIVATADAARYRDFTEEVLLPAMKEFQKTLIDLSLREKNTVQVGRTHGQHAVPITFGFAMAQFVSRFGHTLIRVKKSGLNLRGKIAGAVGSYNASSLFIKDPEAFEASVLKDLKIKPSPISTQIPQHEYMVDFVHAIIESFGVLANIADDMRNLQRSEISEVAEVFEKAQVGSSTMPQKRNPINFENVKSMWKAMMPRVQTLYMDQISDHQRDLTNSASLRFVPEVLASYYISLTRLTKTMKNLRVDPISLKKNFDMNKDLIVAEPLYILLAAYGHPDAHETVREITLQAQQQKKPMTQLILKNKELQPYLKKFTAEQRAIINNPSNYTGIVVKKTERICSFWKKELKIQP